MLFGKKLRELSFLVYGLGLTGRSVINFLKKNNINNYIVWDDNKNLIKKKKALNITKSFKSVDFIVLSPGVSLNNSKNKKNLIKYKKKIITDIDLIFLFKKFSKSIVVTGTNGKSTTCKIIDHVLKKNGFRTAIGGNIGTPILDLNITKDSYLIIEASSFQLSHSQFIRPDFAVLLNISNDHLDWHGSMKNYVDSKFKLFKLQKNNQYSLISNKFKSSFKKKKFLGKLIIPKIHVYKKFKIKIKNSYFNSNINDENMSFVYSLAKKLKISNNSFFRSLKNFKGLEHRYEIFLKKKNYIFINDSKATSFQATKFALENTKNIFWIVGGLPKKNDKIQLKDLKKDIAKAYIIGRHTNFFKNQIKNEVNYKVTKNLKDSIIQILKDIKLLKYKYNNILLSPASASFDQFINFEKRGEKFKELSCHYARKYI